MNYKKPKRYAVLKMAVIILFAVVLGYTNMANAAAANSQNVTLGTTVSVAKKGATYQSSDSDIAYVSADGRVTAKKIGTATITVKKNGKKTQTEIVVVANAKKKSIGVCADEVTVSDAAVTYSGVKKEPTATDSSQTATAPATTTSASGDASGNASGNASGDAGNAETSTQTSTASTATPYTVTYHAKVTVTNHAKNKAKKVVVVGTLNGSTVTFTVSKLAAGASKTVTVSGKAKSDKMGTKVTYKTKTVYSGAMLHLYNYKKDSVRLDYATEDKTAPKISGFIGDNSINEGIPYRTVYSDKKDSFDYFKYVTATDNRDVKVKLTVDTSKVDFKTTGTYTITYIATDKAGNTTKEKAKIGVRVKSSLDSMADSILSKITRSSWSDTKKARAIYNYTRGHIAYTGYSDKSSWEREAINGIRYGKGDCFTYYAVARALLTRAGIPNIQVTRVKGHGHHWWNMVYVQGGFYHFDCTPRTAGGKFCLLTDSQLSAYSRGHGNSHIWAYSKKPKSATKQLSSAF